MVWISSPQIRYTGAGFIAGFLTCWLLADILFLNAGRGGAVALEGGAARKAGPQDPTSPLSSAPQQQQSPASDKSPLEAGPVVLSAEKYLLRGNDERGHPVNVHPFFLNFKCSECAHAKKPDIRWRVPNAADFLKDDFKKILIEKLAKPALVHRKYWEFYFIYDTLMKLGAVGPGKSGLAFGVGIEPLPSAFAALGARVLGTDMFPDNKISTGWAEGNQYANGKENLYTEGLVDRAAFDRLVNFTFADMNHIPEEWHGQFDFVWSTCSMEHTGSLASSKNFFVQTTKLLKPGGVTVHTTEFLLSGLEETLDSPHTSIWRYKDLVEVHDTVKGLGFEVFPIDVSVGSTQLDQYIDLPPYGSKQLDHLKLLIGHMASTSASLVARRPLDS